MLTPLILCYRSAGRRLAHWFVGLLLLVYYGAPQANSLTIGSKDFTEQLLLQAITERYLHHLGYAVTAAAPRQSLALRRAQELGHIDLYWEYTGTALKVYHRLSTPSLDSLAAYQRVRALDAERGLSWLEPSHVFNGQTLAIRQADAERLAIHTLSDLAQAIKAGQPFKLGATQEWLSRADGYPYLKQAYSLEIPRDNIAVLPPPLTYIALAEREVDAALIYTTDGRIDAFKLYPLLDDQNRLPPYQLAPVVRTEILQQYPKLAEQLNRLSRHLNIETMISLNARVDVEHRAPTQVAREYLHSLELVPAKDSLATPPPTPASPRPESSPPGR